MAHFRDYLFTAHKEYDWQSEVPAMIFVIATYTELGDDRE